MKTLNKAVARYNGISLIVRILIGLIVGAVLALVAPGADWVGEFGNLFVGALKGIAPVLATFHQTQVKPSHHKRMLNSSNQEAHAGNGKFNALKSSFMRLVSLYIESAKLTAAEKLTLLLSAAVLFITAFTLVTIAIAFGAVALLQLLELALSPIAAFRSTSNRITLDITKCSPNTCACLICPDTWMDGVSPSHRTALPTWLAGTLEISPCCPSALPSSVQ